MLGADGHQGAGLLRQLGMRGKEGFDLSGAGGTQAGNGCPPAAAPRNTHCQIGQGLEAMGFHGAGGACRQPTCDIVRYQGRGRWQVAQGFDRIQDRTGAPRALGRRMFQQTGQVFPVPSPRVAGQLAPDVTQHGA